MYCFGLYKICACLCAQFCLIWSSDVCVGVYTADGAFLILYWACVCVCFRIFLMHKKVSVSSLVVCLCVCYFEVWMCVCLCLPCHVALCVGISVDLRPVTRTPPLRGPWWLRWVSTHGVHSLDHSGCCRDVGRLFLQAVGLLVDRLYLDVWFTEGDAPPTWKKNTTSGHRLEQVKINSTFFKNVLFFSHFKWQKQKHFVLNNAVVEAPLFPLHFYLAIWLVASKARKRIWALSTPSRENETS